MSNNLNRADDDNLPHYPSGPGHRGGATSKAGAIKVHRDGSAKTQSSMILRQVEDAGANGNTAAEAYAALADDVPDVHVVRARISSLVREGKLADSGRTRDGGCGVQVKVWVAARFAPPKEDDGQADMFASAAPAPARDRPRLTIRKPKGITARHLISETHVGYLSAQTAAAMAAKLLGLSVIDETLPKSGSG